MTTIHHANAVELQPVKTVLEEHVSARCSSRIFSELRIPMEVIGMDQFHLPYTDVCALYERAARQVGCKVFGALCGQQWGLDSLGVVGKYVSQARDTKQLLERMIACTPLYESGSYAKLQIGEEFARFIYKPGFRYPLGRAHYADAVIGVMINMIRSFTGPNWSPVQIETDNPKNGGSRYLEELYCAPVIFNQPTLALVMPAATLHTLNPSPPLNQSELTFLDVINLLKTNPPLTMRDAVVRMVRMRMMCGLTDIEGTSQRLKLGVRSLQRRLAIEGDTYRDIVCRERHRRALILLTETDISVTQIARSIGYDHVSDFSRAFTKRHGFPPSMISRFKINGVNYD